MRISDWSSDVCSSDLRREHDEEVGIGNCGRSSLINQARDLADRFAADGRDEAQADAMLDETWQVAVVVDVQVCRQVEVGHFHSPYRFLCCRHGSLTLLLAQFDDKLMPVEFLAKWECEFFYV